MAIMLYDLYQRYAESHRHYHDLSHIFRMFELARKREMELSEAQVLAIWLHDAVYHIPAGKRSNEELSADLADSLFVHASLRKKAREMVLATGEVLKPGVPDLTDEQWEVCGLDLYSLGTPDYWPNRRLIRQELSHCPEPLWREGRSKFLWMLLDKECIIGDPFFAGPGEKGDWHRKAKNNMVHELEMFRETT